VDLSRLIAIIVEEVAAAERRPARRCACHAVVEDCCPDRLQGVLDAGAARLGLHATEGAERSMAGLIDHTLLKADATRADLDQLCREAAEFEFATVCVNPVWVAFCASRLRGTPVAVCSVVGFPLGATTPDV
jgi:deoxyribose-phosphate aldolase